MYDYKSKTAKDVPPGSSYKVLWSCKKGHEWKTTPKHRTSGGTGVKGVIQRRKCQNNYMYSFII
ncbi:zinc-ribbon domain-containing protein [Peribacillus frigoritolerans]|uniref:zinc-ribbon domain-containing protein n=1 Tax=Peribacillus frigoritolerans TaxID=450367 RepID=UPI00352C151F